MTDEERIPTEEENPAAVGEKDDPVRHFSPLEDYPEAIDAQTDDGPEAEKEPPAKQDAVQTDYAAVAREDLRALKAEFPELAAIGSITELNAPLRYAELRDLGASPREAYLATAKRRPP